MAIKIMLDAGHCGEKVNGSPCNTSPKYYESKMNWKLHLLLKAELEKYGFQVDTTRPDNKTDLGVYERGKCAKGYDLFLSLHSNAAGSKVADGTDRPVVIYPIADNAKQKIFADKLGAVLRSIMQTKQNYQIYVRQYPDRPGVDYYGVIRGAVAVGCKMAFIIEHGFHTDTACTKWLLEDSNLEKLAVAEAKFLAEYYGAGQAVKPPVSSSVKVGDLVSISPNAVYWSGKTIPDWVKKQNWYVQSLNAATGRAVINDNEKGTNKICSPLDVKYLTVVKTVETAWIPAVNDVVIYTGTVHYSSANSTSAKACKGGKAVITKIYKLGKSKHPYHLVRVNGYGASVYGWVDADTFHKN